VRHEAPQGRRVNAVGAIAPYDPAGQRLVYETRRKAEGRDDAAAHLAFVRRLAGEPASRRGRPCVVVLDNYSVHHSQAVTEDTPALAASDVHFCFLPPYSPELNPIEPVWRQVKYQDLPERSHPTDTALQTAVNAALANRAKRLQQATTNFPRPA